MKYDGEWFKGTIETVDAASSNLVTVKFDSTPPPQHSRDGTYTEPEYIPVPTVADSLAAVQEEQEENAAARSLRFLNGRHDHLGIVPRFSNKNLNVGQIMRGVYRSCTCGGLFTDPREYNWAMWYVNDLFH